MSENRSDTYEAVLSDLSDMFLQAGKDTLEEGSEALASLAGYAAERTAHLAPLVGEKGFSQALAVEADNVTIRAASIAVKQGDAFDERLRGMVEGAMRLGARALRIVAGDISAA